MSACASQATAEVRGGYDESLIGFERNQWEGIHVSSPHISLSKERLNLRICRNAVQPRAWKVEICKHLVNITNKLPCDTLFPLRLLLLLSMLT